MLKKYRTIIVDDEPANIISFGIGGPNQFKTLIESPNRVFSRDILMQNVWDEPERSFERAVDTHIKTLRAKLKKINDQIQPIKTHHGLGYSFNDKEVLG